ncbi:MAG: ABC transporter transmembrane domain-containing protein, partial [Gammaproteobacteria bacterium]
MIVKADVNRLLFVEPGSQTPIVVSRVTFEKRYLGQVLQFARAETPIRDEDSDTAKPKIFGFRWFIPELLKHKTIRRDVLLASLMLQLLGLATPLFTQTIIDKVVVHQTFSTLTVIGVALLVCMAFSALMSWVRQYLILHTGNRVDAVLGTQVFEHLIKLPLRYFEHRPTGVVVARLQGVETIREFISSAAITFLLDLPFLFIFLGIMLYYSVPLSLISVVILGAIVLMSLAIAPRFRERLNHQFLVGARNQAFLTEYLAGIETVKSLQMEPQLASRYGEYVANYLHAGFRTKQLGNTYNTLANTLEQ